MAQDIKLKIRMKKKMAKKRAAALGIMRNLLGRKKSRNMCQNAFSPCLQGIKKCRTTREEQNIDV